MAIIYNGTTISPDDNIRFGDTDLTEVWFCDTSTTCCTKVWNKNRGIRIVRPGTILCSLVSMTYDYTSIGEWQTLTETLELRGIPECCFQFRNNSEKITLNTGICVYNYTNCPVTICFCNGYYTAYHISDGISDLALETNNLPGTLTIPANTICENISFTCSTYNCQFCSLSEGDETGSCICIYAYPTQAPSWCVYYNGTRLYCGSTSVSVDCCWEDL